jgi:hypothetical protein
MYTWIAEGKERENTTQNGRQNQVREHCARGKEKEPWKVHCAKAMERGWQYLHSLERYCGEGLERQVGE